MIVAQCLQAFSLGLVFNGWMLILEPELLRAADELDPNAGSRSVHWS